MELARVIGRVSCNIKHKSLHGVRLLIIQPEDANGGVLGDPMVAADPLQAGPGDLVSWIGGSEATLALPVAFSPVDCAIVTIVDRAWSDVNRYLDGGA